MARPLAGLLPERLLSQLMRPKPQSPMLHFATRLHLRNVHTPASKLPSHPRPSSIPKTRALAAFIIGAGITAFAIATYHTPYVFFDSHPNGLIGDGKTSVKTQSKKQEFVDTRDASLPRYRLSEVRRHDAQSDSPWVVHGDKVYNITEWVSAHPGGQVILTAAGGSIDPYWDIFTIHKNQYVYDILSQYLIGFIHPADLENGKPPQDAIEDPFADDPIRHPDLITKTLKPRNAETPDEAMSAQFLTSNDLFYVRNHMWVPRIAQDEADNHRLSIELYDGSTKEYTLRDLKTKFPKRQVTAVLQCSGNRRKHMSEGSGQTTNGLPWSAGAISNACWEGVLLSDVLADAGFDIDEAFKGTSEVKHVQFNGMEAYGASIPIRKAVDPLGDVLLAYSMNGQPLPRDHGFPLRAIVPGHVAARSVKWLNQITLSEEESTSQWQRKDYKCFGPNQTKVDWKKAPAIQELPVQSAITTMKLGDWVKLPPATADVSDQQQTEQSEDARQLTLGGYAYSGGGRSIIRVDVSLDAGKTWTQADLLPDCDAKHGSSSPCHGHAAWSWKRWVFKGPVPASAFEKGKPEVVVQDDDNDDKTKAGGGEKQLKKASTKGHDTDSVAAAAAATDKTGRRCITLVVKATDEVYNCQPESHAATWNFRGNLANAWHRMQVCSECSPSFETKGTRKVG